MGKCMLKCTMLCKAFRFTPILKGGVAVGKDLNISVLYDFYGDMLTDKQQEVIELYYNEDLSLAEIADHTSITRQGVRDSIKRAENQLYLFEEQLGLADRFQQVEQAVIKVLKHTKAIEEINNKSILSGEISRHTEEITELLAKLGSL